MFENRISLCGLDSLKEPVSKSLFFSGIGPYGLILRLSKRCCIEQKMLQSTVRVFSTVFSDHQQWNVPLGDPIAHFRYV